MNHDDMLAVIKAHKEGKPIEWRLVDRDTWRDFAADSLHFNFSSYEYRIKPVPQEVWVNKYPQAGGGFTYASRHHYKTKAIAIRQGGALAIPTLFREVIE